jgi:hypothetical protein
LNIIKLLQLQPEIPLIIRIAEKLIQMGYRDKRLNDVLLELGIGNLKVGEVIDLLK